MSEDTFDQEIAEARNYWFEQWQKADREISRLTAEIDRLNKMRVHCENCGADYMETGIEAGCPCKLRAEVNKSETLLKETLGYLPRHASQGSINGVRLFERISTYLTKNSNENKS